MIGWLASADSCTPAPNTNNKNKTMNQMTIITENGDYNVPEADRFAKDQNNDIYLYNESRDDAVGLIPSEHFRGVVRGERA